MPARSFAPVAGTKLRLGVAFADKDRVVETISSVGSLSAVDASVYHRLDLQSGVAKCKHLDQPATKTTSVFKLAPEAFKQPAVCVVGLGCLPCTTQHSPGLYTQIPGDAGGLKLRHAMGQVRCILWPAEGLLLLCRRLADPFRVCVGASWIKTGSSPPLDLHNEQQLRRDVIATDAISSYWESTASNNDVMPYTAWRYIGTAEGTFRIFPGAAFPVEYVSLRATLGGGAGVFVCWCQTWRGSDTTLHYGSTCGALAAPGTTRQPVLGTTELLASAYVERLFAKHTLSPMVMRSAHLLVLFSPHAGLQRYLHTLQGRRKRQPSHHHEPCYLRGACFVAILTSWLSLWLTCVL